MRVPWLPDVLRDAGLDVRVLDGWRGRGRELPTVYGVVVHDAVTPSGSWTNARVDALLRDGRSDLPGPLSQCGVDFNARWVVVTDGRAHHNGFGIWGNNAIGIEVYCAGGLSGREEPWNDQQREAVVAGTRAILDRLDLGQSDYFNPRVAGHKETDPRRKIDPYRIDMDRLRADVARPSKETPVDAVILIDHTEGTPDAITGLQALFLRPDQKVGLVVNVDAAKTALREGKRVYAVGRAANLIDGDTDLAGVNRLATADAVLAQGKRGW